MLIDFGLSRDFTQTSMTLSGEYLGTPIYSSPEQLFNPDAVVDEQSDVYSLGIACCEALTGQFPFSGGNMLEIITNSRTQTPRIPAELDTMTREVLLRAISRDKERRYKSVAEFAEELETLYSAPSGDDAFKSGKRVSKTTERKRWPKKIIAVGIAGIVAAFVVALGLFQLQRHYPKHMTDENPEIGITEKKMERGDTNEWYRKAAEQGDANAQADLGAMYYAGDGVPKDLAKAFEWYQKAATQGLTYAQFALGAMYSAGDGVPKDPAKAVEWYRKAAEQGDANAQNSLGARYYVGDVVPKDLAKAFEWYRKAAEQGDADAQFALGAMYYAGDGVPKDLAKAFEWYQKAATQGLTDAQVDLGAMYYAGDGVPKDWVLAYAWLNLSAANTNNEVGDRARWVRDDIERRLTAAEYAEAQSLSSNWKIGEVLKRKGK